MEDANIIDTGAEMPEADITKTIIGILESTNSPAIQRAREIIAYRLAIAGDVAPSRIPAPLNITQVGGYINLLTEYGESGQRSRMIAAALGIAGPQINLPQPGSAPPLFFSTVDQPRPGGSQQATFPLSFTMRSDFIAAFDVVSATLAANGAAAPILSPLRVLPPVGSLVTDGTAQLDLISRRLLLAPTAGLRDPATDPLSFSRTSAGGTFETMARIIDPVAQAGDSVPADWVSWACDTSTCQEIETTDARLALTPILNTAGWHQSAAPINPTTLIDTGNWNLWQNVTGLIPGVTTFGEELQALYSAELILNSSVREQLDLVWDGTAFTMVGTA